jgi:stage VI sporulation protein D
LTQRQSGLRFDIYERIHLSEDTVGVKQLEEVELVPHIQVYTEGEQALLKGHLYLTGSYEGESGQEKRTLEHLIPVEITLPLNRIQDVNQVSVDVDNFDVDLLSARSLNVTGILTLQGIEMLSVPEEEWREAEETIFVHEASSFGDITATETRSAQFQEASTAPSEEAIQADHSGTNSAYHSSDYTWRFRAEPTEAEAVPPQAPVVYEKPASEVYVEPEAEDENAEWEAAADTPSAVNDQPWPEQPEETAPEAVQEEKKELKIAFTSKQPAADPSHHLKSLIHTKEYRAVTAVIEEETPTPRTDALEWKRLFANVTGEEKRFSRVRVCIVQKDETLEDIAQKYSLNVREIQLYNRLEEVEIREGKALFIPN